MKNTLSKNDNVRNKIVVTSWIKYARMTNSLGDRLKQARIDAGFDTAVDAARSFGWVQSTYLAHENGQSGYPFRQAEKYAKAFGVSPLWLMSGKGEAGPRQKVAPRRAPIVGYIGDNAEAHYFESGAAVTYSDPVPDEFPEGVVALEVRGDGLFPIDDGWLVFFDGTITDISPEAIDRFSVVQVADGRRFVRKLIPASTPNRFHLFSVGATPRFLDEVTSAAMVLLMRPR